MRIIESIIKATRYRANDYPGLRIDHFIFSLKKKEWFFCAEICYSRFQKEHRNSDK